MEETQQMIIHMPLASQPYVKSQPVPRHEMDEIYRRYEECIENNQYSFEFTGEHGDEVSIPRRLLTNSMVKVITPAE